MPILQDPELLHHLTALGREVQGLVFTQNHPEDGNDLKLLQTRTTNTSSALHQLLRLLETRGNITIHQL